MDNQLKAFTLLSPTDNNDRDDGDDDGDFGVPDGTLKSATAVAFCDFVSAVQMGRRMDSESQGMGWDGIVWCGATNNGSGGGYVRNT